MDYMNVHTELTLPFQFQRRYQHVLRRHPVGPTSNLGHGQLLVRPPTPYLYIQWKEMHKKKIMFDLQTKIPLIHIFFIIGIFLVDHKTRTIYCSEPSMHERELLSEFSHRGISQRASSSRSKWWSARTSKKDPVYSVQLRRNLRNVSLKTKMTDVHVKINKINKKNVYCFVYTLCKMAHITQAKSVLIDRGFTTNES